MTTKKLSKTKIRAIMAECDGWSSISQVEMRKMGLDPNLVASDLFQSYHADRGQMSLSVPGLSFLLDDSLVFKTIDLLTWLASYVGADTSHVPETGIENRVEAYKAAIRATFETATKALPV